MQTEPIDVASKRATIDIVVPVYNALDQVRECIASILEHRDADVGLIVVNDASQPHVTSWLQEELSDLEGVTFIDKPVNEGYLHAVNDGIKRSQASIVICQNSDTIVFDSFFDDLRDVFEKNPDVGVVNPVSTWANWTRIPFPDGMDITELNAHVRAMWDGEVVDIGCASGFSMAMRREMIEKVGLFDEIYAPGYWEETDYCMRALAADWRVVCAPGIYVFHHGWSSFGAESRNANMGQNEKTFRARWHSEFEKLERSFTLNDPLRSFKAEVVSKAPAQASSKTPERLSVLYILPSLGHYGGIISVVQVVNRLVLQGVDARIAVVGSTQSEVLRYGPTYVRPEGFASLDEIAETARSVDVVMATHWSTAHAALRMKELGKAHSVGYFVQDFEPDFYEPGSRDSWMAEETYRLIKNRICKTEWLKQKLDVYGGKTEVIPLGLNTDIFADHGVQRKPMLISMARPSSKRRNWPGTLEVFRILERHRPDIALGVFGFGFRSGELSENITDFGLLVTASEVAATLNKAQVLLDISTFQGFGRPGLEAIACGTVPVLTKNGGITSYARHMHNSLLVDPYDTQGIVSTVCRLFDDPALYARLKENGRGLSNGFNMRDEGGRTEAFLRNLLPEENMVL